MAPLKEKYKPGKYEKLLADILRVKLDKESLIGNMLALVINQENPEENCKILYDYLQKYPNVKHDDIMEKVDEIIGVYIDDDDE